MKETLKYIEVLNWGYGGFAPMTLVQDFEKSLQQVEERLALLDGLDYGALLVEATSLNGKANLLKYLSTGDSIEYGLHFMRDRGQLLEALQPDYYEKDGENVVLKKNPKRMIRPYLNRIDKYRANGLWTDEQWREYRVTLSQVERGFELRLKQFATAYDYNISGDDQKAELPKELNTNEAQRLLDRLCKAGYAKFEKGAYIWTGTTVLCAYFADRASHRFNLSNTMDKEGNITTSWKPFEILFGFKKGSLKTAKQNWMRLNTKFEPTGFEGVAKIFEPER